MRRLPILLFLFLTLTGLSEGRAQQMAAAAGEGERIRIPGTRISVLPASDFYLSTDQRSVANTKVANAFILFSDYPWSFHKVRRGFDKDVKDFKKMGVKVIRHADTAISGHPALKVIGESKGEDGAKYGKLMYLIGFDSSTVLAAANFPMEHPEMAKAINYMAGTIEYNQDTAFSVLAGLDFAVDTTGSGFRHKPKQKGGKQLVLIPADMQAVAEEPDCYFWVMEYYANTKEYVKDRKLYFIQHAKGQCRQYNASPVGSPKPITIDGISGYQWAFEGERAGKKEAILYSLLFSDDLVYVLMGRANYNQQAFMHKFTDLTGRFERR